jgi:hypothetical protein
MRARSLLTIALMLSAALARAQPNWTGLWVAANDPTHPATPLAAPTLTPEQLPVLRPKYRAIYERNRALVFSGSQEGIKTATCEPPGVPEDMSIPYGGEILITPGRVTIIPQWAGEVRRIYTDGRSHPPDPDPTHVGDSIGHWEGNDLMVDTIAISPAASLNSIGTQQSDKMHMVERFHEYKPGYLEIRYHITDPEAFVKPYDFTLVWMRDPNKDDFIEEFECTNNRDVPTSSERPAKP